VEDPAEAIGAERFDRIRGSARKRGNAVGGGGGCDTKGVQRTSSIVSTRPSGSTHGEAATARVEVEETIGARETSNEYFLACGQISNPLVGILRSILRAGRCANDGVCGVGDIDIIVISRGAEGISPEKIDTPLRGKCDRV